jgi:hypothetical protein
MKEIAADRMCGKCELQGDGDSPACSCPPSSTVKKPKPKSKRKAKKRHVKEEQLELFIPVQLDILD